MSTTYRLFDEEERTEFTAELKEWPNTDWGTDAARHSVSPFINFYFPPGPDNHQEAALLMVDIHESFERLLGKPYTIGTHPDSERPHPYGSSRLPDLREHAKKAPSDKSFIFNFTDEKNHASSPTTAGYFWRTWFKNYEGRRTAYSSVTFYYRWQWWLDNREAWRCFVLKTIDQLKAHQVYSGFAMANPLEFGTRSAISTWERALATEFYGLDIDYAFSMRGELLNGIRPPTWAFLLSDHWREKLDLTREQVNLALSHPRISITELQSGQWIELGEQPELYPVELGVPELPMLLNKLLKPIRYDDLGLLGFGQWDGDPNERFTDADSRRWMARFDADSDWPTPATRVIAPLPMPSGQTASPMPLHIVAGAACTQAGWWLVPGQAHTRRTFKQGETMTGPDGICADEWVTWQRDPDQTPAEPAYFANTLDPAPRAGRWELENNPFIARDVRLNEQLPAHEGRVVRWHWTASGMRANSGQPCPYPGAWVCEYKPGSTQNIEHGSPMPTVDGERVVWLWTGLAPV
ncbi:type VI immunity family protein [Pseudomonas fluorescens]|uniref:type VI immunity family protein n=1 Tax=Pseudomonas fluorescens TaxID=294 RepID=UPI003F9C6EB0